MLPLFYQKMSLVQSSRGVFVMKLFINMTTSGRWCDDGAVEDARVRKGEIWGDRSEEVAVECTYWG